MRKQISDICIVGSGRWARIIARSGSFHPTTAIEIVSLHNYNNTKSWIEQLGLDIPLYNSLNDITANKVIVANHPADHYDTCKQLLQKGKTVLCEKPFVPTLEQAIELGQLGEIYIGYEFNFSQYFKQLPAPPEREISITWHSVFDEVKYGERKISDMTISIFDDINPHILTIVDMVLGKKTYQISTITRNETTINYTLSAPGHNVYSFYRIHVELKRNASKAYRAISFGDTIYDFTKLNEGSLDEELEHFMKDTMPYNLSGSPSGMQKHNHWIVDITEQGNKMLYKENLKSNEYTAFREYMLKHLLNANALSNPKDVTLVDNVTAKAKSIVSMLADNPFVTQEEIANKLILDKEQLNKINKAIKECKFAQDLIINGQGTKYWKNSIIPLLQKDLVNKCLNNEYQYPYRIGLYLGQSCMFYCSFCGRDHDAYYKKDVRQHGNELIHNIIDTAPTDDPHRFYLSGGLEPLTNPGLGSIIKHGAARGFKFGLYTNGYMLTEKYLEQQQGVWDLDTLRISLYGYDTESYYNTTKSKKGFDIVKQNAITFSKLRNRLGKKVKFGFNYVVLPGQAKHIYKIIKFVEDVGGDFLTLREDYSNPTDANKFENQQQLIEAFEKIDTNIHIDYGYALHYPSLGLPGKVLQHVTHKEMQPKGFPQISCVIDLYGDVYLYREAGFLDRPGADRYIIGRLSPTNTFKDIINNYKEIAPQENDTDYFDAFDHTITKLLNKEKADKYFNVQSPVVIPQDTQVIQAFYPK
jgi:dTDP-4-amino-4,6-dideoxy-D-glucose ammonia-lyase